MLLPALLALLLAVAPLLRGSWDLWAQSLLHLATIVVVALWLALRIFVGFVPLPSNRTLLWCLALVALGSVSLWCSPVRGLSRPEWFNFLQGLWIFPAMASLGKDERGWVDQAVRASAWVLVSLAFYQHFALGDERPAASLLNQNAYAGAILLMLPIAAERRDWLLAAGLLANLWWSRSVGAWLGLALAVVVTQHRRHPIWSRAGWVVALAAVTAIYGKLDTPEVLNRWAWWRSAWAMASDRPFFGFGPGSFSYALAAYEEWSHGLHSLFAHQYLLQAAAEFGLPFLLLWSAGLWHCLSRAGPYKRFGLIAVLIHSLWDYALSVPSTFWLFCYCAASSNSHSPRGVNVPSLFKAPALALALGTALLLVSEAYKPWSAQMKISAADRIGKSDPQHARRLLQEARRLSEDSEASLALAGLELSHGSTLSAAAALEDAVRLNPYRRSLRISLAQLYRRMGLPAAAAEISAARP